MIYGSGPRARRVYAGLRERLVRGGLVPGTKLPPHRDSAAEFGVAPMTARQVLSRPGHCSALTLHIGWRGPALPPVSIARGCKGSWRGLLQDASAAGSLLGGRGLTERANDALVETLDRERSSSEGG